MSEYSNTKECALKFALFLSLWMPFASFILFRENKYELTISLILTLLVCLCCYLYSIYRYKKDNHFFLNLRFFYSIIISIEFAALIGIVFTKEVIIIPITVFLILLVSIVLLYKKS